MSIKTINKYYCDRCGEEICTVCKVITLDCPTSPKTAIQILHNKWEYAHLCDKCKESFKAWWEKSSANQTGETT